MDFIRKVGREVERFKRSVEDDEGAGSGGESGSGGDAYACADCGEGFERAFEVCPDCGSERVAPVQSDASDE